MAPDFFSTFTCRPAFYHRRALELGGEIDVRVEKVLPLFSAHVPVFAILAVPAIPHLEKKCKRPC